MVTEFVCSIYFHDAMCPPTRRRDRKPCWASFVGPCMLLMQVSERACRTSYILWKGQQTKSLLINVSPQPYVYISDYVYMNSWASFRLSSVVARIQILSRLIFRKSGQQQNKWMIFLKLSDFYSCTSLWSFISENSSDTNCLLCDLTALWIGRRHYGSPFFSCFSFENPQHKHT